MNLDKLEPLLCFAFQLGDGPFKIKVIYDDHFEWLNILKDDIDKLSDLESVLSIEIVSYSIERRWRDRSKEDRRKVTR